MSSATLSLSYAVWSLGVGCQPAKEIKKSNVLMISFEVLPTFSCTAFNIHHVACSLLHCLIFNHPLLPWECAVQKTMNYLRLKDRIIHFSLCWARNTETSSQAERERKTIGLVHWWEGQREMETNREGRHYNSRWVGIPCGHWAFRGSA